MSVETIGDIFISYASENREQIQPLVDALERQGWTVWWDREISIGTRYDQEIRRALDEANCVVVAWTRASVDSDWVRDEANRANEQGKLCPVRLEDVDSPLGFGVIQTADLIDWDGKSTHIEFTRLVQAIRVKCSRTIPTDPKPEDIPFHLLTLPSKVWSLLLFIGLPIIFGILSSFIPVNSVEVKLQATVSEFSFVSTTQQEISDPIAVSSFKAAGLTQIEIPSTSEFPHETLTMQEDMLRTKVATSGGQGERKGNMTLDTITILSGNSIRVVKTSSPFQYKLTLVQSDQPIRVNVKGAVEINVSGFEKTHRVYSFPKPLLLHSGQDGLDMEMTVVSSPNNLLPIPLSVSGLRFVDIEERIGDDRTTAKKVSTFLNGKFSLNGELQQLAAEEYLQFEHSEGSLKTIRLNQDYLEIEFYGQVQGMKSCRGENICTNLMPRYWDWLMFNLGF